MATEQIDVPEANMRSSQLSGVKRKSTFSEQPPQKRYKVNPFNYCHYNTNNDRPHHDNESLYSTSESPALVLFSPQQTSEDDEDQDDDLEDDDDVDYYDMNHNIPYHDPHRIEYNPDIIQGLEFLIPHRSINPFYTPNDDANHEDHARSSCTELLSSCSVSPSLAFELNETEKMDKNINSMYVNHSMEKHEKDKEVREGGGPPPNGVIELLSDDDNNENDNEFMRYPHDSSKPVIITIGDIGRLRPLTYLNDSIIDFYLKYLYNELLTPPQRDDIYIFTQFFYTKLDKSLDDKNETARLKLSKWTNVNIFDKKLVIIPIHKALHWSLAIITNPGYDKALDEVDVSIDTFCTNTILSIINTQCAGEPEWVHAIQTHPKVLAICDYPCKILHFDSMRGCHPTNDIMNKIRIYLNDEWKRRMLESNGERTFTMQRMPGVSLGVPQQNNSSDCGVYLLHFAQLFALNPFYNAGNSITRQEWFTQGDITLKRDHIKDLCVKLRSDQGKEYIDVDKELEDSEEDDDEDALREFEDRLWETEQDILKDRLCAKARIDPQLYYKLHMILDEIDFEMNQ